MTETQDGRPYKWWTYFCRGCQKKYRLVFPDPPPKEITHRPDLYCRKGGTRGHRLVLEEEQ